jgi:hypothetical protein
MNGEATRPKAIKTGENDTWSHSLMSHKARCHSDAGPFSFGCVHLFGTLLLEEADPGSTTLGR